jgi:hypothetical protein
MLWQNCILAKKYNYVVVTAENSDCDHVDFDQRRSLIFEGPTDRTSATLSFLGAFAEMRKAIVSFVMSVCPSTSNNSAPAIRIFKNFDIWVFSKETTVEKHNVHANLARITVTVPEDLYTVLIMPRLALLTTRNVSEEICREKQNTILYSITYFFDNPAMYEVMCKKKIVQPDRPQMTIWRMRIACWIPKATDTHSEYVMLIVFPLQQRLQERSSLLRYTHVHHLSCF